MTICSPVVAADWLATHLDDPQVVIVDCRFSLFDPDLGQMTYQTSHIPGAYFFDLNRDLSSPMQHHGGRHPLPDLATLAGKLAAIGLSTIANQPPKLVVAYDDSRFAFAARFWWLLQYLGYNQVAVLDGGFQGWQTAGYPVTDRIPPPQSGTFIPQLRREMVVEIERVKQRKNQSGVVLVDSREGDRYRGEREPIDPIAGHIPGAINYPWQEVTDEQGYMVSTDALQQRWQPVAQADEIIVYCGSGVTACVNLLSLAIAGIPTGRLYAGSWSDWCSYL